MKKIICRSCGHRFTEEEVKAIAPESWSDYDLLNTEKCPVCCERGAIDYDCDAPEMLLDNRKGGKRMQITVETPFGTILVTGHEEDDYPGVWIELVNGEKSTALAMIEAVVEDKCINICRYEEDVTDAPVDIAKYDAEKVEKMLNWAEED